MLRSTTSTKTCSNVNLALQRWDEQQETKKGNTVREREIVMREVHVCIPLQKEEEREERERERDRQLGCNCHFWFHGHGTHK
jgi:hypothetical protein